MKTKSSTSAVVGFMGRHFTSTLKLLTFSGVALLCAQAYAGTIDLVENGVDWGTNYYNPSTSGDPGTDGVPTAASPAWTLTNDAPATTTLGSDYLRIDASGRGEGEDKSYFYQTGFLGSKDATLEFTFQVASTSAGYSFAGGIFGGVGDYTWSLQLGNSTSGNILQWGGSNYTSAQLGGVVFTDLTTIRIVMTDMDSASASASLYIKSGSGDFSDALVTIGEGQMGPYYKNNILFGVTATGTNQKGVIDWYGVRWDPSNAIAPIPEPAPYAIALFGIGLFIACRRFRHASRSIAL